MTLERSWFIGLIVVVVAPQFALISAGYRNRFGHPHPDVLARLETAGARVLRTDESGAILLRVEPGAVYARTWRQESPRYWRSRPGRIESTEGDPP